MSDKLRDNDEAAGDEIEIEDLRLTTKQQVALDSLLLGNDVSHAADAAGVHRVTVYRWLRECHRFNAAYNLCRSERNQARQQVMCRMSDRAVSAMNDKIIDGDGIAAYRVLRGLGYLDGKPQEIGSGSPKELESQTDDDSFQTKRKLLFQMLDSDPNPDARADFFLRIRGNKPPFEWQYDYEQGVISKEELDAPGRYVQQRADYAALYAEEREKAAARKQAGQSPPSDTNGFQ